MKPYIQLIKTSVITDFPSGSSINYYDEKLFLIGDDANNLLILDTDYQPVSSVPVFNYPEKRIPKSVKTDFETSTLIDLNGTRYLLILGSASREERKKALLLPVADFERNSSQLFTPSFYSEASLDHIKEYGINEINIEGSTVINDALIVGNRGNSSNSYNHLIITNKEALNAPAADPVSVIQLNLPVHSEEFIGVSELCYIASKDMLLFTLSSEATGNSYDDGIIGDSYLGWVYNISNKLCDTTLMLDEFINLSSIDVEFQQEKIEGICVESEKDNVLTIHLVSDNDRGESKLFKIELKNLPTLTT